jgi:hypothetical protein
MGHEKNEKEFLIHTPSILHGALGSYWFTLKNPWSQKNILQ